MTPEPIIPLLQEAETQLEQLRPGPEFEARLQLRLRQQVDLRRKRGQGRLLLLLAAGGALVVGASLLDPGERRLQPIPWLLPPLPLSAAASSSTEPPPPPSPEPRTPDLPRADLQRVPLRVATHEATPVDQPMEVPYNRGTPSRGPDAPEPVPDRPPMERGKGERLTLARSGSEGTGAQEPAALLAPGVMQLAPGTQPRAVQPVQPAAGSPRSTPGAAPPAQPGPVQGAPRALSPSNQGTAAPTQPRSGPENATPAATYRGCFPDLVRRKIEPPPDEQGCEGPSFVRWSSEQNLWVGVISCGGGAVRIYLAESEQGPFLPALDIAGHGQDHCELLVPGFTLGNEDDIASGSCASCSTGPNIAIEGKAGYVRSQLGEPFVYVAKTSSWSYQTSRLSCGCELTE